MEVEEEAEWGADEEESYRQHKRKQVKPCEPTHVNPKHRIQPESRGTKRQATARTMSIEDELIPRPVQLFLAELP
jgi:hypothetical protein